MKVKPMKTQTLRLWIAVLGLVMTASALAAQALTASVMTSVHLRAGPSTAYPSVAMLLTGSTVEVFGCEEAYNWCDVQMGPNRGWVDAAYLQAPSPGGTVIVANSAVMLGVPTVTFVLNSYWGNYYVGRPWYAQRVHYYNYWHRYPHGRPPPPPHYRPPVVRPPPPPRPPPGVRPPPPRPPPGNTRPPGGKPPGGSRPPGTGKPPPGNGKPPSGSRPTPPATTRPAPGSGQ